MPYNLQAFEAYIITLKRIVIDRWEYRCITYAETQNILVTNEDERGGKAAVKVSEASAMYLYIVTYPDGRRESGKIKN